MPKNRIVGGFFEDYEGNPLCNGYLLFSLSEDEITAQGTLQFFVQEDGSSLFVLEDSSGDLLLETGGIDTTGGAQILAGIAVRINLDMLGSIADTSSVWPNDFLIPAGSYYLVTAYKWDGTKAWKNPQQWIILSNPSPFNVGSLGIYPGNTAVPSVINYLPSLLQTIPPFVIPGPGETVLIQVNGVNAGSQLKVNLVAGTGLTIADDGLGDITFSAATFSGNSPLIVQSSSATGFIAYGVTPWVLEQDTGGGGGITRTLPTAIGSSGSVFILKKVDAALGTITIATTAAQTIDGSASWILSNQYQYVMIVSNNSNWTVISNN